MEEEYFNAQSTESVHSLQKQEPEEEQEQEQELEQQVQQEQDFTQYEDHTDYDTSSSQFLAATEASEMVHLEAGGEDFTEPYVCPCAWQLEQIADATPEEDDVPFSPTPSEKLYDELVHRDYSCVATDEVSSEESEEMAPESMESVTMDKEPFMMPFKIRWSLGFTIKANLLNFTKGDRKVFFLATAHKGITYDYTSDNMRYVHGHIRPLCSASVDETGHWLVTGGYGFNSKVIISDTYSCKQLLILHNTGTDKGSLLLAMAPDARYFFALHHIESPLLRVWKWTYGKTQPDCEHLISKHSLGMPQNMLFHPNDQTFFMIGFEKMIVLGRWNEDTETLEDIIYVSAQIRKMGIVTDVCFAMNRHEIYASTSNGYIAIFGNMLYTENFREHPMNTNKIYVKKIKVVKSYGIKKMKYNDNIICTLDDKGSLKFFDPNILLLYWLENEIPPIRTMAFSLNTPKKIHGPNMKLRINTANTNIIDSLEILTKSDPIMPVEEEERVMDYETLLKQGVRSRASLNRRPFIVRDFIAACQDGRVFHVDIVNGIYQPYFTIADSPVASICVSTVNSLLYVAYETGRLTIFDYETLESTMTVTTLVHKRKRRIRPTETEEILIYNCNILVSQHDVHLALARTNGEIIFLSPTLDILQNQRYKYTNLPISHMRFSENNLYLAICDSNKTMMVLRYQESHWLMHVKVRGHTEPLTDMMFINFVNPRLFSIGQDRYLIEYSLEENLDMPIKNRVKIEDTAIPLCFLKYPNAPNNELYFLVANSEYKYKLIQEKTMKCRSLTVGPHQGCYDTPICGMGILPNSKGKYYIFQNENHMGIQKLPPDGSPYKHIGILANPRLGKIALCNQGKYIFTYSHGEGGILIWKINLRSVDILHFIGGKELDPFYCFIEGGANGWFFKEMEDLFCYTQILHREDAFSRQDFSGSILISDVPDVLRACGFYPSEYEVEQLIYEIKHKNFEKTGVLKETITFTEFVKLYLNHRPAAGITVDDIKTHFNTLFENKEVVTPQEFSNMLCKYGEAFTPNELNACLQALLSDDTTQYDENILEAIPPISFTYFSSAIIGILAETAYSSVQLLRHSGESRRTSDADAL